MPNFNASLLLPKKFPRMFLESCHAGLLRKVESDPASMPFEGKTLLFYRSSRELWQHRRRIHSPWYFDADQRIVGSWHEVVPSATQASQNRQNTVAHWVEKINYRRFERLWVRAQRSWVILLPIFVERVRIYNAKRVWDPMGFPSKHLIVFSPEKVNIKKLVNFTTNTKNYGRITLNTKPHSDPPTTFLRTCN